MKMRYLIIVAVCLALLACHTPNLGGGSGAAGSAEGGKASSTPVDTKPNVAFAQPGADATAVQVTNSDTTSNPNAGDAFTLVFGGAGAAQDFMEAPDPVGDALVEQYHHAQDQVAAALTPEDRDFWIARADAKVSELAVHEKERIDAAKAIAGNFEALHTVLYAVVSVKLSGVPPEKLPPETAKALAEAIAAGVKPALEGQR